MAEKRKQGGTEERRFYPRPPAVTTVRETNATSVDTWSGDQGVEKCRTEESIVRVQAWELRLLSRFMHVQRGSMLRIRERLGLHVSLLFSCATGACFDCTNR